MDPARSGAGRQAGLPKRNFLAFPSQSREILAPHPDPSFVFSAGAGLSQIPPFPHPPKSAGIAAPEIPGKGLELARPWDKGFYGITAGPAQPRSCPSHSLGKKSWEWPHRSQLNPVQSPSQRTLTAPTELFPTGIFSRLKTAPVLRRNEGIRPKPPGKFMAKSPFLLFSRLNFNFWEKLGWGEKRWSQKGWMDSLQAPGRF